MEKTLSEFLKNYRLSHNLTQIQMAEKIGITQTTYSFIESGRSKPSFQFYDKVSTLTGKSVEYLRKLL